MVEDSQQAHTIHDRSGLKLPHGVTDEDINAAELRSVSLVEEKYLARWPSHRTAPFTDRWMIRLHKEMFGRVWRWAGKTRQSDTNIGIHWYQINVAVRELADDIPFWHGDPVEDAGGLHFRAISIHPFQDGNGRWARLLANIWLSQQRSPIILWPEPEVRCVTSSIGSEYISAIKAGENGDIKPFLALHRRFFSPSPPRP